MTRRGQVGLTLGIAMAAALIGFVVLIGMFTSEYWCSDRSPWWGPPQDHDSSCSGHAWASSHPDDYPWVMPK